MGMKIEPIALYSIKLTDAQQWQTVIERELISIEEILKGFRSILLGQKFLIYTDHKNLTCKKINTDRVLIWMIILEDYVPYI